MPPTAPAPMPLPRPPPPFAPDPAAKWLVAATLALVGLLVAAAVALLWPRAPIDVQPMADAWIRAARLDAVALCHPSQACDVVPAHGAPPFSITCDANGCALTPPPTPPTPIVFAPPSVVIPSR